MLAYQHRRRRGDDDLLARQRRDRGGAERDLGLAIADIADDEPVHRLARRQIGPRRGDRARLVGSFGEGELGGETLIGVDVGLEHRGGLAVAFGGERGQPARALGDRCVDRAAAFRPARPVERVERDRVLVGAIAPDAVGIRDRHQPPALIGIFEDDRVAAIGIDPDGLDPGDEPDPEILVDHDIADADVAHVAAERRCGIRRRKRRLDAAAEQIGGGDDAEPGRLPAMVDRHVEHRRAARFERRDLGPMADLGKGDALRLGEARREETDVARRAEQDEPVALRQRRLGEARESAPRRLALDEAWDGLFVGGGDRDDRAPFQRLVPALPIDDRQRVETARLGGAGGEADIAIAPRGSRGVDRDHGVGRMIEQRLPVAPKRWLGHAANLDRLDRLGAELRDRVVEPDRADRALDDLDAYGGDRVGGVQVDDLPAHRHFARLVDPVVGDIADLAEHFGKRRHVDVVADPERRGASSNAGGGG